MSQKIKQQISNFVDGDKDSAEVIEQLRHDQELSETFGRYNLIGDVMRDDVPEQINLDLAGAISEAIDKEPVVIAPNAAFSAALSELDEAKQEQVDKDLTSTKTGKNSKVISLFKPLAQYGIAASFAAALVIGFQNEPAEVQVVPPALGVMPIGGVLDPVSIEYSTPIVDSSVELQKQRRMNAYVLDHSLQLKHRQEDDKDEEKQVSEESRQVKPK